MDGNLLATSRIISRKPSVLWRRIPAIGILLLAFLPAVFMGSMPIILPRKNSSIHQWDSFLIGQEASLWIGKTLIILPNESLTIVPGMATFTLPLPPKEPAKELRNGSRVFIISP